MSERHASALLTTATADEYERLTGAAVTRIADRFRTMRQPFSGESRAHLQHLVDSVDLDAPGTGTDDGDALEARRDALRPQHLEPVHSGVGGLDGRAAGRHKVRLT